MIMRTFLPFLAVLVMITAGCQNRNADDRVTIDEETRMTNHGPGYTAVATRRTDRARFSNGVVIVNESGEEPVYVTDAGYYRAPAQDVKARSEDMEELLKTVDELKKRIQENRYSSPETQRMLKEIQRAYEERPKQMNPNSFGPNNEDKKSGLNTSPKGGATSTRESVDKGTIHMVPVTTSDGTIIRTSEGGAVTTSGER